MTAIMAYNAKLDSLTAVKVVLVTNRDSQILLVPDHAFEWFGDYSVWSCPSVRVSVRVQKLFHHLLLAATSQEIDTYTI